MQDLIAGRIDYFCTLSATAKQQIEGKLVKAIAILSRDRSSMLPELASAQEQGLDFEASTWFGFFFPRGTPDPIIQKLHDATVAAIDTASVQERLKEVGAVTVAPERRSPDICKNSSRARSRKTPRRSGPPASRSIDALGR